jgi:hypothetical protein
MITISNNVLSLGFDPATGAILSFRRNGTSPFDAGYEAIRQPKLALGLSMRVPTAEKRNRRVLSQNQKLSSYEILEDRKLRLIYQEAIDEAGLPLPIRTEILVELNGEEASFSMSIDNQTDCVVEEVAYPCLGGFSHPEGEKPFTASTAHFQGGMTSFSLSDGFPNPDYWGTDWPTVYRTYPMPEVSAPFILYTSDTQGIYVGVHDVKPNLVSFVHEYKPGYSDSKHSRLQRDGEIDGVPAGFCMSVTRLPFIASKEKLELPPVVISLFTGDWHQGLEPYLNWRKTWFQPVPRPQWVDDADCWITLHINSPEDCCRYRYTDLPELMRDAKKGGVKVLQLIGWARGGQDGDEPYQDTDPRLGTKEELKAAIREIEEMGIHVLPMCKFKWADQSTKEFKEELMPYTLKDIHQNPVQFGGYGYQTLLQNVAGGSRRSGFGLCHLSKEYRKIALRELRKILELEPSGIMYDELANPMLLCFDPSHGHRPGACHHVGSLDLAKEFYEEGKKRNPDFFMAGEGPNDAMSQYYLGSYLRSFDGGSEPIHTPIWKYLNPDLYIATCLVGSDDREMVNQCLTYGYAINYEPYNFKGKVSDVPKTKDYILSALDLRRKLKDTIWNGRFRHTQGVSVELVGNSAEFIYSLFENRNTGDKAVVIANQERERSILVKPALKDGGSFSHLYFVGEETVCTPGETITVPPRSCCVLTQK